MFLGKILNRKTFLAKFFSQKTFFDKVLLEPKKGIKWTRKRTLFITNSIRKRGKKNTLRIKSDWVRLPDLI